MTERFGVEIIKEQVGCETYYHVGSRDFDKDIFEGVLINGAI